MKFRHEPAESPRDDDAFIDAGVDAAFIGRSIADGVLLAERVEGVASVAHAIAYCEAIERLAGIEAPEPAQLVRVLPEIAAWAATLPQDILLLEPWLNHC